jgi:hypothetical protein
VAEPGNVAMLGDGEKLIQVCSLDDDLTPIKNRDDVDGLGDELCVGVCV